MDAEEKAGWYITHLEKRAPHKELLDDAETSEKVSKASVAREAAEEWGFTRRLLDGLEEPPIEEDRLETIREDLEEADLEEVIPPPKHLWGEMHSLVNEAVRIQIGEAETSPMSLLRDADRLMSVGRTLEALGAEIPPGLFGQAMQLADRLREGTGEAFVEKAREKARERACNSEKFGRFLWCPILGGQGERLFREVAEM